MSEGKDLLKNGARVMFTDEHASALNMAAECMGLKCSTLIRQYVTRGLIADKFLQHPMQKYADAAKKAG
jgi:hypothetical protein